MTQEEHFDVASYALGVLDDHDAARFEDHLIDCAQCAYELESFVQVADVLADVDAEALIEAEHADRDGALLGRMLTAVETDRRQAHSRRLYSLAAGVVLFAVLSIGALFAGGRWLAPDQGGTGPAVAVSRGSSELDNLPNAGGGLAIGGTELPGEDYEGTDPRTGVVAAVGLEKKDWGTQISFAVGNITGPRTCRLVVVRTDGTSEPLVSWSVDQKGWGTAANPQPLLLQAMTAAQRESIAHIQIQELAADGTAQTLVRVP